MFLVRVSSHTVVRRWTFILAQKSRGEQNRFTSQTTTATETSTSTTRSGVGTEQGRDEDDPLQVVCHLRSKVGDGVTG